MARDRTTVTAIDDTRRKALELSRDLAPTAKNLDRVSRSVGVEASRWAFNQWELRKRASSKFQRASEMYFDREGLEMASHETLAESVHARGFPPGSRVADLTCGLGADLVRLSRGRTAIGYEIDSERAAYAQHNLAVHGCDAEIRIRDCLSEPWDFEYAFADPARRSRGVRTLDPAQFMPNLTELASRMKSLKRGVIKLSPMLSDEFLESLSPDRAFVSHQGECKEVLVFLGTENRGPQETGVWAYLEPGGKSFKGEVTLADTVDEPGRFIVEADPAAIRAHALGNFGLPGLGDSNGYLSADEIFDWPRVFETLWHGTYRVSDVKRALEDQDLRIQAVKVRGVELDVDKVRKQLLRPKGSPCVLIVYPVRRSTRAVLARLVER